MGVVERARWAGSGVVTRAGARPPASSAVPDGPGSFSHRLRPWAALSDPRPLPLVKSGGGGHPPLNTRPGPCPTGWWLWRGPGAVTPGVGDLSSQAQLARGLVCPSHPPPEGAGADNRHG